MSSRDSAYW